MKNFFYFLVLVSLISFKPEYLFAQWVKTNGPYGAGDVPSIVSTPGGTLLAGINGGGVYRSNDGGKSWTEADVGIGAFDVSSLVIAPDDSTLYAGTFEHGIYRSTDNGRNWLPIGMTNYYIESLAVSPDDKILLAGTGNNGIFRSLNNGFSWTSANSGLEYIGVSSLIAAPDDSTFFVVGIGTFRSTNRGISWSAVSYDSSTYYKDMSLVVSPNDSALFIGTSNAGVVKVTRQGTKWVATSFGLKGINNIISLAFSPSGSTLFAGTIAGEGPLYVNKNFGETFRYSGGKWIKIDSSGIELNSFSILPNGTVLAGSNYTGIYRSTYNGTNWKAADSGITDNEVDSLAISPDGSEIAAGTSQGLYITGNNGESWIRIGLNNLNLGNNTIGPLAFFPDGKNLYAGISNGELFHFTNNSSGWFTADTISFGRDIYFLTTTPGGKLFAGLDSNYNVETFNNNKWTLTDSLLDNSGIDHFTASPDGKTLFAVNTYYGSAFISTDGGQTWTRKPNIDSTGVLIYNPSTFAISPGGAIFAGSQGVNGFYQYNEAGVFRSTDNGQSWEKMKVDSNVTFSNFTCIVVSKDGAIFAATAENGIYLSTDNGKNWNPVDSGLTSKSINSLAISADGSTIYVGTGHSGVWKRSISELTSVEKYQHAAPLSFSLEQNYPNPFNPSTTISYSLPTSSNVRIEIFNVLGKKVATLVNGYEYAGNHKVDWNAGRFASGIYFYKLSANNFSQVKKMILLK